MSRRRNGTNRTGAAANVSRFTGAAPKRKTTVSLEELNGRIANKVHGYYSRKVEEMQDGKNCHDFKG